MRDKSFMIRFLSTEHVCIVECHVQIRASVESNLLHDGVANTLASVCAAKRGISCVKLWERNPVPFRYLR
jgi:hypothetical protein